MTSNDRQVGYDS